MELFRNIPVLVQLFLWFYVLPELVPETWGRWLKRDLPLPEFWTSVLCLGVYAASRVAEQVRSGIEAVPRGQLAAALASGLTIGQAYRLVLLPIAFRIIIPPLTSEFLSIIRTSSVALTIGLLELTAQSRQIENATFQGFESFAAATALYAGIAVVGDARHAPGRAPYAHPGLRRQRDARAMTAEIASGGLQPPHAEVLSRTKSGRASKHAKRRRLRLLEHPSSSRRGLRPLLRMRVR